jgi:hypothetical protein
VAWQAWLALHHLLLLFLLLSLHLALLGAAVVLGALLQEGLGPHQQEGLVPPCFVLASGAAAQGVVELQPLAAAAAAAAAAVVLLLALLLAAAGVAA